MVLTAVVFWACLSILNRSATDESLDDIDADSLPAVPGPLLVTDNRGRSRWTVYIPPHTDFPLSPAEYARICSESSDLAAQLRPKKHGYFDKDPHFMDVHDAQRHRLLPLPSSSTSSSISSGHIVNGNIYSTPETSTLPVCTSSLTFLLQTDDPGLGPTLLSLWQSYGLALRENRAFFIDDSNWAYGEYTTYFHAPPMPACRPPPVSQRVPWPVHARHLLVSSGTTKWMFGEKFNEHFEDGRKKGSVERKKPLFDMLRTGYEALFHLTGGDARYLEKRTRNLRADTEDDGMTVGIHVRRGDRRPFEFQYQKSYIPLDTYLQSAKDSIPLSLQQSTPNSNSKFKILLASDDPDVYTSPEFNSHSDPATHKAQRHISLASKSSLETEPPGGRGGGAEPMPMLDTNTGWEGGFFSALFWSLGAPPQDSSHPGGRERGPAPSQYTSDDDDDDDDDNIQNSINEKEKEKESESEEEIFKTTPPASALHLRELVGRAYLLDIAVLGAASDAVVCGVSSASCRMLGVMMGWDAVVAEEEEKGEKRGSGWSWSWFGMDKGMKKGGKVWRNVDGEWGWRGVIW